MAEITPAAVEDLFRRQFEVWPMAKSNFDALKGVEVKEFDLDGLHIKVQFNPARMVSSAAKVDKASLAARKCFLCAENRPDVQEGIDWNDRYTVLINPFPIFPRHLTIPDKGHVDQLIDSRIADMAALAMTLEGYTVFYNGPRCGASAPDHMHFQAGNSDFLTLGDALEDTELQTIATEGDSTLALADKLPLKVFVIDADTPEEAQKLFGRLYAALPDGEDSPEPMMNILAYATPKGVRIVVIPRKRHRPSFYGMEGEGKMVISPASVDMGGVFITPRPQDFAAFDADLARRIYDELCLTNDEARAIAENIR